MLIGEEPTGSSPFFFINNPPAARRTPGHATLSRIHPVHPIHSMRPIGPIRPIHPQMHYHPQ